MRYSDLKPKEFLFLSALIFYVTATLFQSTYLYNLLYSTDPAVFYFVKMLKYGAYFLCIMKLTFNGSITPGRLIIFLFSMGLMCVLAFYGADKGIVFYMLIILSAYNVDFSKILKVYICLQVLILFFCLISAYVFGIGNDAYYQLSRVRYFLGFGWVNRSSYIVLAIILELIALKKGRLRILTILFLLFATCFTFVKTDTAFPFFVSIGVLCFFSVRGFIPCCERCVSELRNHAEQLLVYFFALIGIGICLVYNGENTVLSRLNRITDQRLALGHRAIEKYGLGLFGNKTEWMGASTIIWSSSEIDKYEYVDCAYLQIALDYGIMMLIVVLLLYQLGINYANKEKMYEIKYILLIYSILSIFEPRLIDFGVNPFLLYGITRCFRGKTLMDFKFKLIC